MEKHTDNMKNQYPILSKAPIKEAIIDIQVSFEKEVDLELLQSIHTEIRNDFPVIEPKYKWTTGFKFQKHVPVLSEHSGSQIGYLLKSSDGTRVVQFTNEGFTFNKLSPYETWEDLSKQAESLWNTYREKVSPKKIERLGLRYINRIEIPLPIRRLKDYIRTCPDIASGLPNSLSNLLMRLEIPIKDSEAIVIITESIEEIPQTSSEPKLPLIFDIDVIKILNSASDNPAIWDYYQDMRNIKNEFFFGSITEKTKELLR